MNRIYSTCFALLLLSMTEGCTSANSAQHSGTVVPPKKINLFNGKNLDGWYTYLEHSGRDNDPKKVFTVRDGMIVISGEEFGSMITKEEYDNYKLVVEFKWGGKTVPPRVENARDNGLLIHSTGKDGGTAGIWMNSIECQIIEGGTGDFIVIGDGSPAFALSTFAAPEKQNDCYIFQAGGLPVTINEGRINWFARDPDWQDVIGFRGKKDVEKPTGDWNRIECIAAGDKISVFLNDVLVNQAFDVKPSRGRIQLQSEGAEIFFRKVELTPLNKK